MQNKLKGNIRISRVSSNTREDYVEISIQDKLSGITFVEVELSFNAFAEAVLNMGADCLMEVRGLKNVGKKCIQESFAFHVELSGRYQDREKQAYEQGSKIVPEGWILSSYFGSRESFEHVEGNKYIATTQIYKFVDVEE